jgi:hypothetical protein
MMSSVVKMTVSRTKKSNSRRPSQAEWRYDARNRNGAGVGRDAADRFTTAMMRPRAVRL